MTEINIRRVTINDLVVLQNIGKQTFSDAYAFNNTKESIEAYLEDGFSTEKLTSELADSNSKFYFASIKSQIIGYLKINFGASQTEIKSSNSLEIQRIYVVKEFYGQKVGQRLLEKTIQISRQKKLDYIWLGVWEKNPDAIRFYEKNGFKVFDKHVFTLGDEEQTDIMMKLKLI